MLQSLDTYDYEYRNFIDQDLHDCGFDFYQHNLNKVAYIRNKLSDVSKECKLEWNSNNFEIKRFLESKLFEALYELDDYNSNVKVA